MRLRLGALVALGGALGTLARFGLAEALPTPDGVPWATLVVNLAGSFLLGVLLEALDRAGEETSRGRALRLGLGTGLLGGFTTFSSLALEVERLLAGGELAVAGGYVLASLALGLVAAMAGIAVGRGRSPERPGGRAR
ncbi:CrcB family protein [Ruania suaedae]|uniref:fluoride efflux transporter FluC n=1 Tax=Ruania suaedae TaxID=2897774 RepID=UPI001E6469B1|nr:CrcB family protein [Ruania suaedae]UFU02644.1 CrcB family protein [Ruania suaedae]